jgi:hypothetical protein
MEVMVEMKVEGVRRRWKGEGVMVERGKGGGKWEPTT